MLSHPTLLSDSAFWVNDLEAARRAESKALQLHIARLAGFSTPETIISNDPIEIRSFLRSHLNNVIRKSLMMHFWNEGDLSVTNKTSHICESDLPSDRVLALTAEIYQVEVKKSAEIRVFFMGNTYFALRIDPGKEKADRFVDWRVYHFPGLATVEPISLPSDVVECCKKMMKMLGVVTGSFDLLVDQTGSYIFAELNQGGMFLWMEDYGLPVLQAFTEFLIARDPDFVWDHSQSPDISSAKVQQTQEFKQLIQNENSHLIPLRQMENGRSGKPMERTG